MDKTIIDKLVKFGLITNIGVNANDYKDVDDLINKGIITIPGAKAKIAELLNPINPPLILVEKTDDESQVVDNIVLTTKPVMEPTPPVAEHTPVPVVDDVVNNNDVVDSTSDTNESPIVVEEIVEEIVEETVETTKRTKKN